MKKEILVIGRSGVGKSSFINYLLDGQDICKTGVGKPVTEKGIFKKEYSAEYNLYDTWGLEADKHYEWKKLMEDALNNIKSRNVDLPEKGYFDCIFYCLDAKSARLQEVEKDMIKLLYKTKQFPMIVLTKCDIASEKEKSALKQQLNMISKELKIIEVSSIEEETFCGKSEAFGKKETERLMSINYINKLINFVPDYLIRSLAQDLDKEKERIERGIKNKKYKEDSFNKELKMITEEFIPRKLNENLEKILSAYNVNVSIENQKYSSKTLRKGLIYGTIAVLAPFSTLALMTGAAGLLAFDLFRSDKKLMSNLEKSINNIKRELEKQKGKIKSDLIEKANPEINCSKCETKLKIRLNQSYRCPKCNNIENPREYYSNDYFLQNITKIYDSYEELKKYASAEEISAYMEIYKNDKEERRRLDEAYRRK